MAAKKHGGDAEFRSGHARAVIELAPAGPEHEAQIRQLRRDLRSIRRGLSQIPGSMIVFPDGRVAVEVEQAELERRRQAFLVGLKALRRRARSELRAAHEFEPLRQIGPKGRPGSLEAAGFALSHVRRPEAAKLLIGEVLRLREEGENLVRLALYDRLEKLSRFRLGRLLSMGDVKRLSSARESAQNEFTPPDLMHAPLEDLHRPKPRRGPPQLADPWVVSFPRVYREFGPHPTDAQLHHAAVTQPGISGARPTKRQATQAWRTVERMVVNLERRWPGFIFAAREKMLETKPSTTEQSRTLEGLLREVALSTGLIWSRESPTKKAAALEILMHRHRRELAPAGTN